MDDDDKQVLGRLVDPAALDAGDGPRALLRVEAPSAWLEAGGEVAVATPARLVCARCEGGGCDACGRSGALAAPEDVDARHLVATLPPSSGEGVALRLVRPFGELTTIEQLILEVRPGAASRGLTRISPTELARRTSSPRLRTLALAALFAVLAAITVGLVLARR